METNINLSKYPQLTFNLARINIFLGANGTGKSQTLSEIKQNRGVFYPHRSLIFVEGGRAIKIHPSLTVNRSNFDSHGTLEKAIQSHKQKTESSLSSRVTDALILLEKKAQAIKEKHSDNVTSWQITGGTSPIPVREKPPLERLFELFSEIFPTLKLTVDPNTKNLLCSKNGGTAYSASGLSDGEKQVLSILADIAMLAEPDSLIIIDEPELNLNPSLACRLWDTLEDELPECIFIYATHNIGFAMRGNVERVFVLSNDEANVGEIKDINEIDPIELRSLLGSIPAILSTDFALITEGNPESFDAIFYRWLTGKPTIEVVPMGGCADVHAVASRTGVWDAIAPSVQLRGVIDRDFRSDEFLAQLEGSSTIVLKYHEAESYLCLPKIVRTVAERIGAVSPIPEENDITQLIIDEFSANYKSICASRIFQKSETKVALGVQRSIIKNIQNEDVLRKEILKASETETLKIVERFNEEHINQLLDEEFAACNKAIADRDIDTILKLLPAKNIIHKLAQMAGTKNATDYARACARHLGTDEFEELKNLKAELIVEEQVGEASAAL